MLVSSGGAPNSVMPISHVPGGPNSVMMTGFLPPNRRYRSGTDGDPERIEANVRAKTDTSLQLYRRGHLPVMGEWLALPLNTLTLLGEELTDFDGLVESLQALASSLRRFFPLDPLVDPQLCQIFRLRYRRVRCS